MKVLVAIGLCWAVGCSTEDNLGNTYTLRSPRWAVTLGGVGADVARGVAIAPDGDVVAYGSFWGAADFGAGPVTTASPGFSAWVSKRAAADGSQRWTRVLGTTSTSQVGIGQVVVDGAGNVLVTGNYQNREDFGGATLIANADVFVAKYDPNGSLLWVRGLGADSFATNSKLAVDSGGRVYVSGSFTGRIALPTNLLQSTSERSCFLLAYDADGTPLWGRLEPIRGELSIASDGALVLAGVAERPLTLGDALVVPKETSDLLIARFTPNGDLTWVRPYGEPIVTHGGLHLAQADDDRLATTTMIVTPTAIDTPRTALLGANGTELWNLSPGGRAVELAIATYQDVVLSGGYAMDAALDFGAGLQPGVMYLAVHNASGALVDARLYGHAIVGMADGFTGLATSDSGALAFSGYVDQPIDFGSGGVSVHGDQDAVLGYIDLAP